MGSSIELYQKYTKYALIAKAGLIKEINKHLISKAKVPYFFSFHK